MLVISCYSNRSRCFRGSIYYVFWFELKVFSDFNIIVIFSVIRKFLSVFLVDGRFGVGIEVRVYRRSCRIRRRVST